MKQQFEKITSKIKPFVKLFQRYKLFMLFISVLLIYLFLVFRINVLSNREPSDTDINTKLQTVSRPRIDQTVISKIQELQDNSVTVKSLFNHARKNPFQE